MFATRNTMDAVLSAMACNAQGVSDLFFVVGKPPLVEKYGALEEFELDGLRTILDGFQIEQLAAHIMAGRERLQQDLATLGSCDCSYAVDGRARFRVSIFRQSGRPAVVMRKLQTEIPTLDGLALPQVFKQILKEKNGIVFVTGGTGSGKTTTLAAMLDALNQTQPIHILTLEDPIEYVHSHSRAVFNQRELGKDFPDFATGLRAALRQAPKVILVGEIRDRATIEIAMTASETGHLVFATLHTINAGQTIHRILGMFAKSEEPQVRERLAETVRYIVSQRLVEKTSGGRLLVTEIMGSNLRVREAMIYGEGENRTFQEIIEAGDTLGWHTFDQRLLEAYRSEQITEENALLFCTHKNKMCRDIDLLKKLQNQIFEAPSGLQMARGTAASPGA